MPPKLANLKPRLVIRALQKQKTGAHVHLKHPTKPGRVTIPNHQRFDLPKPIVRSIIRQAGLSTQEFFDLLKK